MSDTDQNKDKQDTTVEDSATTSDEVHPEDAAEHLSKPAATNDKTTHTEPKVPPQQSRQSGRWAWLAILISIAALLGTSYLYWQQGKAGRLTESSNTTLQSIDQDLRDTQKTLLTLEKQIAALDTAQSDEKQQTSARLNSAEQRLLMLDSLNSRSNSMEAAIANIQGISKGSRSNWLLAEAQYYMQIANAQLQLVGNPVNATMALRLADERLQDLGDPAYTNVRRALSDEIQALEATSKIDIEGISLTLASLSRVVQSLPVREDVERPEPTATENIDDLSGFDRAGAAVKNALKSVVSVRRSDEQALPLISPDAKYFLRANLSLQLQAARLALLRGEKSTFQNSIDDASGWLREYYSVNDASVVGALQTLDEIRNQEFSAEYPDISESLRLLRQQRTLAGDAQ